MKQTNVILACSAIGSWAMQDLFNTTGCVFALGAISDLRGFPDVDHFKNHPLEWIKHFSEKKNKQNGKKKKLPCISELGPKSKI